MATLTNEDLHAALTAAGLNYSPSMRRVLGLASAYVSPRRDKVVVVWDNPPGNSTRRAVSRYSTVERAVAEIKRTAENRRRSP